MEDETADQLADRLEAAFQGALFHDHSLRDAVEDMAEDRLFRPASADYRVFVPVVRWRMDDDAESAFLDFFNR